VGVKGAVDAEMAALAGCDDVGGYGAGWGAVAQMSNGEVDCAPREAGGLAVGFDASACVGIWAVHSTLAGAFALCLSADEADGVGEGVPVWGIE
jgi:hypothetical protein